MNNITTSCGKIVDGAPFYGDLVCGENDYQCWDCLQIVVQQQKFADAIRCRDCGEVPGKNHNLHCEE